MAKVPFYYLSHLSKHLKKWLHLALLEGKVATFSNKMMLATLHACFCAEEKVDRSFVICDPLCEHFL